MNRRTLVLDSADAWAVQQVVRDNHYFIAPDHHSEKPDPIPFGKTLREKVNDALVRFADEDKLETVEIDCEDEELWIIDRHLPVNSYKGATTLLQQVFRILYESRIGIRTLSIPEVKARDEERTDKQQRLQTYLDKGR